MNDDNDMLDAEILNDLPPESDQTTTPPVGLAEPKPSALVAAETDALLDVLNKRLHAYERVLAAAIHATLPTDWVNMSGKAYLQSSGAEKVGVRFGVSAYDFHESRDDYEDEAGPYYVYTFKATVEFGGQIIESIGTCSSRDKFFGRAHGKMKPMHEVDVTNIKKKAYTNCYGNGVRRLLALNNIPWATLEQHLRGAKRIQQVDYKSQASKAVGPQNPTPNKTCPVEETQTGSTSPRVEQTKSQAGSVVNRTTTTARTLKKKSPSRPFWRYQTATGADMLLVKEGAHFKRTYLENLKFGESIRSPGTYGQPYSQELFDKLEKDYVAIEAFLQEEKRDGMNK